MGFFFFLAALCSLWDLVPQPGIEPVPSVVETWGLNHWTTLEKGKATHSNILAWRIPWTTSIGLQRVKTGLSDFHFTSPRKALGICIFNWLPQWVHCSSVTSCPSHFSDKETKTEEGNRLCPRPQDSVGRGAPVYCSSKQNTPMSLQLPGRSCSSLSHLLDHFGFCSLSCLPADCGRAPSRTGPLCFKNLTSALVGRTVGKTLTKQGRSSDSGISGSYFQQHG